MSLLRIGMFGGGTVGGGVYEMIHGAVRSKQLQQQLALGSGSGPSIVISKICVRDTNKARDFDIDPSLTTVTSDPKDILQDDSINCIVEVMGGTTLAKDVVLDALRRGKSVVTANKALLAQELTTLQTLLQKSTSPAPVLAYEAAVCGGIPIIHTLQSCYQTSTRVSSIRGICNGTTNYILDKMEKNPSLQYADVLVEAQQLGYAEADPTADVEGHDVRAKIALLAQLAFGQTMEQSNIPCVGITKVTKDDFAAGARGLGINHNGPGFTIKLIGTAAVDQDKLSVYVTPMMTCRATFPGLAYVSGPGNSVVVSSDASVCTFAGPGAGRYPTAHSVVADLVRLAKNQASAYEPFGIVLDADSKYSAEPDYRGQFYLRCNLSTAESGNPAADIQAVAADCGIELAYVDDDDQSNPQCLIFTTKSTTVNVSQMNGMSSRLQQNPHREKWELADAPFYIPILR
jgi:homoserine dehydrogenase